HVVGPLKIYIEKYMTNIISNILIQMKIPSYSHIIINMDTNGQY
ncbi:unnamed protein product, partial [Rotaria sordida]